MLIEYEAGEGIPKEHAAGGFLKLIPTTAQFAQVQTGGKPFDPSGAANMKVFVEGEFKIAPTKAGSSN
jgi:hypothetical protein